MLAENSNVQFHFTKLMTGCMQTGLNSYFHCTVHHTCGVSKKIEIKAYKLYTEWLLLFVNFSNSMYDFVCCCTIELMNVCVCTREWGCMCVQGANVCMTKYSLL